MKRDRRTGLEPVPDRVSEFLNETQLEALRQIETFGWKLQFIRRPPSEQPVVVVFCSDGEKMGVLEEDGTVNMFPDMDLRCSNLVFRETNVSCKRCGVLDLERGATALRKVFANWKTDLS